MPFTPLTDGEVTNGVRELVHRGKIRWTDHSEERLAEYGYDKSQVKECLLKGVYEERPIIDNRAGPIAYVFRICAQVDGELLRVVAKLIPEDRVVVITVIEPN